MGYELLGVEYTIWMDFFNVLPFRILNLFMVFQP